MRTDLFFYVTTYGCVVLMIVQAMIILLFLTEFCKPKSELKTAYFIIFVVSYIMDVLLTLMFTAQAFIEMEKDSLWNDFLALDSWYFNYSYSYWNAVLAFNRCTAFTFPNLYKRIWKGHWLFFICLTIVFSPFIFDPRIVVFYDCYRSTPRHFKDCKQYHFSEAVYTLCFNLFFAVLSLLLIVYGLWRYQPFQKTKRQNLMEKRLIFQSLSNSIIQTLLFVFYQLAFFTHNYLLYDLGNVVFILDHIPSIAIFFAFCQPFRTRFCKFYHIPLPKPVTPSFEPSISTVVTFKPISKVS